MVAAVADSGKRLLFDLWAWVPGGALLGETGRKTVGRILPVELSMIVSFANLGSNGAAVGKAG